MINCRGRRFQISLAMQAYDHHPFTTRQLKALVPPGSHRSVPPPTPLSGAGTRLNPMKWRDRDWWPVFLLVMLAWVTLAVALIRIAAAVRLPT
jgi:hypothetical protein